MHDTSFSKMSAFVDAYLSRAKDKTLEIIDIGALSVDGHATYRPLIKRPGWRYRGADMVPGANVDIVLSQPYQWEEFPNSSVDVVVSGQVFEHVEFPWLTMAEISRVLKPLGVACLIVPSSGVEHRYPKDCWRIYPDGMVALARCANLDVVEVFTDWGLGPWQDTFAVLQKSASADSINAPLPVLATKRLDFRFTVGPEISDRKTRYITQICHGFSLRTEAGKMQSRHFVSGWVLARTQLS